GDGGPATLARLAQPVGMAVGPDGALYIADSGNYRVRRVGTDGIIRTIAGTNICCTPGDGGPAANAYLDYPEAVAVGPDGSVYIATTYRIRRVGPDGIINTLAGNGTSCKSGGSSCGD